MTSWVVFLTALALLVLARFTAYRLVDAAWSSGRLSARGAGIALSVIAGIVPLAAGLWFVVVSADKLPGVLLLAIWLFAFLPWGIALTRYMERHGIRDAMDRTRRPPSD